MDPPKEEIWVVDTSSLNNVKELIEPESRQQVLDVLTFYRETSRQLFPQEVLNDPIRNDETEVGSSSRTG